jgi:micrococcal nuclease
VRTASSAVSKALPILSTFARHPHSDLPFPPMGRDTEQQRRNRRTIRRMLREAERGGPRRRPASRALSMVALVLGAVVLFAYAYATYSGVAPWQSSSPTFLPNIAETKVHQISSREITIVDGDTIRARGGTIRLVGFDAPESGLLARCAQERELSERATAQLRSLVAGGSLELQLVPCACRPGTEGTRECNYGRSCGYLRAYGRDVGATMIQARVARPYIC